MDGSWTNIIQAKEKWYDLKLKEFWEYRHLVLLFVKRNYATRYKQTILGPLWLFITPLFTVFTYTVVFDQIAGLSTDGIPGPVFYMAGNIVWTFFSSVVSATSDTFISNAHIFGKIYYPRLIAPVSTVLTRLGDFLVQFLLLAVMMAVYTLGGSSDFRPNCFFLLIPVLLSALGVLGMGTGLIISSLTTKYRDLRVLVGFGLQLWMYASPVIYSSTLVPQSFEHLFMLNPAAPILLTFKYALFGTGSIPWFYLQISLIFSLFIGVTGIIIFHKVERNFLDTI